VSLESNFEIFGLVPFFSFTIQYCGASSRVFANTTSRTVDLFKTNNIIYCGMHSPASLPRVTCMMIHAHPENQTAPSRILQGLPFHRPCCDAVSPSRSVTASDTLFPLERVGKQSLQHTTSVSALFCQSSNSISYIISQPFSTSNNPIGYVNVTHTQNNNNE
jgi:hypothetical protein